MIAGALRRSLASGAVVLYALVVGLLVPLHGLLESAEPSAVRTGPIFDFSCQDRDCHDPAHHHGAHSHDPATCPSCAQARAAVTPAPSGPAPERAPLPAGRAAVAETPILPTARRAPPRARGPPLLP